MTSAGTDEAARETLAREALDEFTHPGDVGPLIDEVQEDGVWTLHFVATTPGYPGWRWTVSLAQLEDADPTVLETELIPAEGALLAPDWVPWSTRLEEWRAQQSASGAADADADPDRDEDADDDADDDDADDDVEDEESGDDDSDDDIDEDGDLGDDVYDGLDPEAALDADADADPHPTGG